MQEFSCLHLHSHFQKLVEEQWTAVGPSQFATIRARKASPGSKAPCGRPSLGQNSFANACAHVVREGIRQGIPVALFHMTGSYMWSLNAYCRLRDLNPTISHLDCCQFGSRFRGRTTIWSWNLEMPTVLPTCYPRGKICSWSEREHQHCKPRPQSARATGTLSIPWRLRNTIASWFLSTWEQHALGYRWSYCRHTISEYGNSGSIIQ